jgi:hypothetical protein
MKQTLYQTVAPKPDDDSFLLQIKERGKEFVVTQIRYHYDSKSGIQESIVKTITGQHPFMKRSEAMQVYESHRRTLAAKGYKYAFSLMHSRLAIPRRYQEKPSLDALAVLASEA